MALYNVAFLQGGTNDAMVVPPTILHFVCGPITRVKIVAAELKLAAFLRSSYELQRGALGAPDNCGAQQKRIVATLKAIAVIQRSYHKEPILPFLSLVARYFTSTGNGSYRYHKNCKRTVTEERLRQTTLPADLRALLSHTIASC